MLISKIRAVKQITRFIHYPYGVWGNETYLVMIKSQML